MRDTSPSKITRPRRKAKATANGALAAKFEVKSFLSSEGAGRSTVKYATKKTVFKQGNVADAVYYIQSGKIQLSVVSEHRKQAVTGILIAGDFFGEGCLAGQPLHMASAITLTESTVFRIDKQAMVDVLHTEPLLSEMFMAFLLSRNIQFEGDLVDQLFNSSEQRLARVLLLLSNFGKDGKLESVIPRISQETLAARVGTTRSRINAFMNKFRKLGFIEYNSRLGGLKVHSALLNVIVHDLPTAA
jgi:CRP/FNR family cyclic AMP-dependent transcriptional regulator